MIVVEKFVRNMLKLFTWVSFLLSFLQVRNFTCRWFHLGLIIVCTRFKLVVFGVIGTLLMTPERRRAIWAIYGE